MAVRTLLATFLALTTLVASACLGPAREPFPGDRGDGELGRLFWWYDEYHPELLDPSRAPGDQRDRPTFWPARDCFPFFNADQSWGEIIGCQEIEFFDVRSEVRSIFARNRLKQQGCDGLPPKNVHRAYVRTLRHFYFFDKESRIVFYVPEGYVSDGMSIPQRMTSWLPGEIWDTATPRTLPAALFHDRYICLANYAVDNSWPVPAAPPTAERPIARASHSSPFRNLGCSNDAFMNALRTGGTANFISLAMRTAVGIANTERHGYCPIGQFDRLSQLEIVLNRRGSAARISNMPASIDQVIRKLDPEFDWSCRHAEPTVLCLSDPLVLEALARFPTDSNKPARGSTSPDSDFNPDAASLREVKIDAVWTELIGRIRCYDAQSTRRRNTREAQFFETPDTLRLEVRVGCSSLYDISVEDEYGDSPFRAGDLWLEAAGPIVQSPATALAVIDDANTINQAMQNLIAWNAAHPIRYEPGVEPPPFWPPEFAASQ